MPRVFRSKIDWLLVIPPLMAVASAAVVVAVTHGRIPPAAQTIMLISVIPVVSLILWLILTTDYTLDRENLTVRCGPFRWRIALDDIGAVTATRDPSSGPALSLERLRVEYGNGRAILISPREADAFLDDLERLKASAAADAP